MIWLSVLDPDIGTRAGQLPEEKLSVLELLQGPASG